MDSFEIENGYVVEIHENAPARNIMLDERVIGLCAQKYPGHANGCPNVGTCLHPSLNNTRDFLSNSPKISLLIGKVNFDILRDLYGGKLNMRWWQPHVKKLLRNKIEGITLQKAMANHAKVWETQSQYLILGCGSGFRISSQDIIVPSMESAGILVLDWDFGMGVTRGTLYRMGIQYEWPPEHVATMVALVAEPKDFNPSEQDPSSRLDAWFRV